MFGFAWAKRGGLIGPLLAQTVRADMSIAKDTIRTMYCNRKWPKPSSFVPAFRQLLSTLPALEPQPYAAFHSSTWQLQVVVRGSRNLSATS